MLSGLVYPAWFVAPFFVLASPKREDPFLHFHALQSILFGVFSTVAAFVLMIAIWVLMRVLPSSGGTISAFVGVAVFMGGMLGALMIFTMQLFLGWRATSGQFLRLPVLGDLAEARMAESLQLDYTTLKLIDPPVRPEEVEDPVKVVFRQPEMPGPTPLERPWTPTKVPQSKEPQSKEPLRPAAGDPGVFRRWLSEE